VAKAKLLKTIAILPLIIGAIFFSKFAHSATPSVGTTKNRVRNPTLVESTWLMPQVSVVMPSSLTLANPNFEVAYSKQFPSLTQAGLAAVTPLFDIGGFRILSTIKLGFSYKAGVFEMVRSSGEWVKERLKLSWVPMSLGAKFLYTLPNFPYIKPSMTLGGGAHWCYQAGNIEGATGSFWVPYYFISPALSFLEGTTPSDWFGGFTFGVTYQHSLSARQSINGVSFDLGINILL